MPRWSAGERALIDECLHTWSADTESSAIATNLRSECALGLASFVELLRKFAGRLADSPERWRDASSWSGLWVDACKPYELRGRALSEEHRPQRLGRAWAVSSLARAMAGATGLPERATQRLLDKHLPTTLTPRHLQAHLQRTPLGGAVTWATCDPDDTTRDPFDRIPASAAAVRCALGLGYHPPGQAIVALTYSSSSSPSHPLPLHRPTIADANSYMYYRPHPDPTTPWGFTAPLAPNPDNLRASVTGAALHRHRLLR